MTGRLPPPAADAAVPVAVGLLCTVGGSVSDASHLAAAISSHRRQMRLEGSRVPPSLDVLERLFAGIGVSSQRVTGGQQSPRIATAARPADGELMPQLLTRTQAAKRMRCSLSTVKRREADGALTPVRHGRVVRHRVDDIDNYMNGAT